MKDFEKMWHNLKSHCQYLQEEYSKQPVPWEMYMGGEYSGRALTLSAVLDMMDELETKGTLDGW